MSLSNRPRRIASSALNTPTLIYIKDEKSINSSKAETILSRFIDASEDLASGSASRGEAGNGGMSSMGNVDSGAISAALSQLKRVQRNLRGLPPLATELNTSTDQSKKTKFEDDSTAEKPQNKRIKFSDADDSPVPSTASEEPDLAPIDHDNSEEEDVNEVSQESGEESSITPDVVQQEEKLSKKHKEKKNKKEKPKGKEKKEKEKEKDKKEKIKKKDRKHKKEATD